MRIVTTLSFGPIKLEKRENKIIKYIGQQLEKSFSETVRNGRIDFKVYGTYNAVFTSLERGYLLRSPINTLSNTMPTEKKLEEGPTEFQYIPPCENCALLSSKEDEIVRKLLRKKDSLHKIFYFYDKNGKLIAAGIIVNIHALQEALKESFIAVA